MKFLALSLLLTKLVVCYDNDDILNELAADLKRILEKELALPMTSELSDEDLQRIEGSGDDVLDRLEQHSSVATTITIPTTTTTIPSTTTTHVTTRAPIMTTHKAKKTLQPKLLKMCQGDAECFSDSDCGQGKCFGTHIGTCNCRACVPSRNCTEDSECGGLRGGCHFGECHCERALLSHGFGLMVDALLSFCDKKICKAHGDDCHGLPCHVGKCRCSDGHK